MVTLTMPPEFRETTARNIRAQSLAWNRLHRKLRRQFGPFDWVWVREQERGSNLHLHLLWTLKKGIIR